MPLYPVELDLQGKTAVVVGLGAVGRRKAAGLIETGACVIAIEPNVMDRSISDIKIIKEYYQSHHLKGASLVIAAATAEVNRQVVLDAKARGIWVNSASDPSAGDFTLPASWRDGPITLTVSTSGASPALASTLRDKAGQALGPAASGLAQILLELRPEVLEQIQDPEARRQALTEVASPEWLDRYAQEGPEATRVALRRILGLE